MPIEAINRTVGRYYEENYFQSMKQLYNVLFPAQDTNTASGFLLDRLVRGPARVAYRSKGAESISRTYQSGAHQLIEPPTASMKTPIDEALLKAAIAGVEASAGFGPAEIQLVGQILRQHIEDFNMTKNKQAIDVLRTGIFSARGPADADLGLDIDFDRNASLDITYDFTTAGASVGEAFATAVQALAANGASQTSVGVILGRSWLSAVAEDAGIREAQAFNPSNVLAASSMIPQLYMGADGLRLIGAYRAPGMISAVYMFAYEPGVEFVPEAAAPGATTPFIPDKEAVFFVLGSPRYEVNRGINALDGSGRRLRLAAPLVTDTWTNDDPVEENMRTQSAHALVPANINHTARSTGNFSAPPIGGKTMSKKKKPPTSVETPEVEVTNQRPAVLPEGVF